MEPAESSHEEALEAKETREETEEETETPEDNPSDNPEETKEKPEKVEKSTDRQPTAEEFKAMDGAKKHFETENKKLKDELLKAKKANAPATGDPMEAVRLGKALAETSEEEADVIITYAKGKFNTLTPTPEQIIQASKDDWVKDAITARRAKVADESKSPEPSSPQSVVGDKTSEELQKMSKNEFAKIAAEAFKGKRSGI